MERVLTIRVAGADFHARQRGDKAGAIFLHGFAGDLHTWDGVWARLPGALPAMRYDLRGFGQSPSPDDAPFGHADDLLAILDATGVGQCDLVGVSMGGSVALNFTLDHPERVRNLVLISPGLVGWEWSEDWQRLWRPIVARARAGAMDEARRLWWQHPLFETTRNSAGGQDLFESIMRYSGAQWVRDNHRLMMPDVDRLFLLGTRTLLLTRGRDQGLAMRAPQARSQASRGRGCPRDPAPRCELYIAACPVDDIHQCWIVMCIRIAVKPRSSLRARRVKTMNITESVHIDPGAERCVVDVRKGGDVNAGLDGVALPLPESRR